MTTKVGIAVLAALVVVLGGCGQEGGGAFQAGWPVPGVETRAQLEVSLVVEGPVDVDGGTLYGARLLSWITVQVTPGGEGAKRALVRTQGEVAGSFDIEEKGEPRRTRPFPGGGQLSSLLFGRGGLPGATATRMLDGAPSSEEVAAAAWTLLGLVPPPPGDAALAAGTAWTGDAAWPLFPARVQPARFEIESMDAETIRVHATWLGADFEVGWSAPAADLVVDVSRRDGLALAASLDVTLVSTEDAPDGDGVVPIPVKGTVKRISWTEPPAGPVDVEAVAMDLAASDPVTRAKAATRLGALWPDAGRVAPALVGAFDDEDVRVREAATGALRHLAERGVPTILAFLDDDLDADREGYEQAMSTIQMLGAKVTPRDLAGAGVTSPPAGAVGLLSLCRFGAGDGSVVASHPLGEECMIVVDLPAGDRG